DPDIDGEYTATLTLPPGLYAYKFVVDGNWMLDPSHKYRAYDNGVENSGLRVPDCHQPLVEPASGSGDRNGPTRGEGDIIGRYSGGNGGPGPDMNAAAATVTSAGTVRALESTELAWNGSTWELTINLKNLSDGKHTVAIALPNTAGTASNTLYVPFWVEER